MRARLSSSSTAIFLVEFKIPSENQLRYRHWSKAREFAQAAKAAWLLSCRSSPSGIDSLMTIISALAPRPSETALRQASVLTMATGELNGSTELSKPVGQSKPL